MSYPTLSAWLHTATERVPVPLINDPAVYDAHCKSKGGVCFIAFLPDEDWELGLEMMRRVAERVWVTPNIINGQFTTQPLPIQFAWAQADHQLAVRDAIRLQNAPGMLAINAVKNVFTTCVLALAACVPTARCRLWQHPGHAAIPPPHCLTRAVLRCWCPTARYKGAFAEGEVRQFVIDTMLYQNDLVALDNPLPTFRYATRSLVPSCCAGCRAADAVADTGSASSLACVGTWQDGRGPRGTGCALEGGAQGPAGEAEQEEEGQEEEEEQEEGQEEGEGCVG